MWRSYKALLTLLFFGLCCFCCIAVQAETLPFKGRVVFSKNYLINWHNQTLTVWNAKNLRAPVLLHKQEFSQPIHQVEVSANQAYVVAGFLDGSYQRWVLPEMKPAGRLHLPKQSHLLAPFALSPDGFYLTRTLFSQTEKKGVPFQDRMHVQTWSWTPTKYLQKRWAHEEPVQLPGHYPGVQLAFHPLGNFLTFASESGQIKVYDTSLKRWVYQMSGSLPFDYSRKGNYFVFLTPAQKQSKKSWNIRLWYLPTGHLKTFSAAHVDPAESSLVLSDNGRFFAYTTLSKGKYRWLWVRRVTDGKTLLKKEVPEAVDGIAFSPYFHSIVTSSLRKIDYAAARYVFTP